MSLRHLILSTLACMLAACGSKTGSSAIPTATTPSGSKPTLAPWTVTTTALWTARLDVGGNLAGTPFLLTFSFSDGTATQCTATLSGNLAAGIYTVSSCTAGASGLASSTGTTPFDTGGAGTYANSGTVLTLCKSNSSCQTCN